MKIKKKSLTMFFLTLPIFKPMCMGFFSVTNTLYFWLSILTWLYIVLNIIQKRINISFMTQLIVSLESIVFISTLINHGSLRNSFDSVIALTYVALLVNWCVEEKESSSMIASMMLHLEICTYVNLVTLLLKPDGFFSRAHNAYGRTQEWFLGSDHYFILWALPAFLMAWIYREYTGKSFRSMMLIILTGVTQLIRGSTTGLIGVAIFFVWMLLPFIRKVLTPFRCVVLAGILFVCIVYLQSSDFLKPIIVGVLGKDMTYTNRLEIWDNSFKAILAKPLFGRGVLYNEQIVDLLGRLKNGFRWEGAVHCHCQYLEVGFKSGLVGLTLYITAIVSAFAKCKKSEYRRVAQAATVCLFILCIISITEVYEYSRMYLLFILPYYLTEICYQLESEIIKKYNDTSGQEI